MSCCRFDAKLPGVAPKVPKWARSIPVPIPRGDQPGDPKPQQYYFMPQTIAHRGYKAAWPENSMAAFRAAVEVGAHAIETDVHLSQDGVVVLSHDPSLLRCFGVDRKIKDCTWDFISTVRSTRQPAQPLPRLSDLLEWLTSTPELEKIWVLLDIKIDDNPHDLLAAVAKTLAQVPSSTPWSDRVVLGCWNATFMTASLIHLPSFPLAHISLSPLYSYRFLPIPNLAFNMQHMFLVGSRFLNAAKRLDRPVFAWTVDDPGWMRWCLGRNLPPGFPSPPAPPPPPPDKGESGEADDEGAAGDAAEIDETNRKYARIDGVITDDPKLFLQACASFREHQLRGKPDPALEGRGIGGGMKRLAVKVGGGAATLWDMFFVLATRTGFYVVRRLQGRYDHFQDMKLLDGPQDGGQGNGAAAATS